MRTAKVDELSNRQVDLASASQVRTSMRKPKVHGIAASGVLLERKWESASCRIPLTLGERVRLNAGSPTALVVETGADVVTIAWPTGEATFPPECLHRVSISGALLP
jgi:hypothetical protein